MTIPSRVAAAALLLSLDPPPWAIEHARAVAEVAAWLARRTEGRGIAVDRGLVEAAALLHDVDKLLSDDDPARSLPHGEGSAAWLRRHGYPELGGPAAGHPVTRLADRAAFGRWMRSSAGEARIVAYADKRAGQRLESMDRRFASWRRRYPDTWNEPTWLAVRERAARLEAEVCGAAGVAPDCVRRLPWTAAALRVAAHG